MSNRSEPRREASVLVTGGTGYLASWVIAGLLNRGTLVRTTVRDLGRANLVREAVREEAPIDGLTFVRASLLSADGWGAALDGIDHVLHVASPLPTDRSQDLVGASRAGVHHVLSAATKARVRRVVLTSSALAATSGHAGRVVDETTWGNPSDKPTDAYARSKTLSERDAWKFAESSRLTPELTTILPGFIQGPVLGATGGGSSVQVIRRLLDGKMPALPNIGWGIVDVRDLADLHVEAMTVPEAAGQRFLAVGEFLWLREIAALLRANLGAHASKVSSRRLPDFVVRQVARVNPYMALVAASLGQKPTVDSSKAERVLGWHTRPAEQSITDAAHSLIGPNKPDPAQRPRVS